METLIVTLAKDGNEWCVLAGENLQEGLSTFSHSPELALEYFFDLWVFPYLIPKS